MSDTSKGWLSLLLLVVMALTVTVCMNQEPDSADTSPARPACTQDSTVLNSTDEVYQYTQCDDDGDGDIDRVHEVPDSADASPASPASPDCFYSGGDKWCDVDGDGIVDTVTQS